MENVVFQTPLSSCYPSLLFTAQREMGVEGEMKYKKTATDFELSVLF